MPRLHSRAVSPSRDGPTVGPIGVITQEVNAHTDIHDQLAAVNIRNR